MAAEISDETIREIASHYEAILKLLGEDITREGLVKTPMRAAKAMVYATRGYRQDPDIIINDAIFSHEGSRMVIVKDIEFYSLCEHHNRAEQTGTSCRFLRSPSASPGTADGPDLQNRNGKTSRQGSNCSLFRRASLHENAWR